MTNRTPSRVTVPWIAEHPRRFSCLTAYDYTMALLLDRAGVDVLLVGDSVSAVMQGRSTTLPVTMDHMIYHSSCVTAAVQRALVVGDMPFLSYQVSKEEAVRNAGRFVKEAGVAAVKLEGGVAVQQMIEAIVTCEIPVMGHVGLTPQSFNRMGGYRVQGKGAEGEQNLKSRSRTQIINDALAVQAAGAFSVVLEGVPSDLAEEITELLSIPTIGIGAGASCSGQILVTHDMVGLTSREVPKFVKQYAQLGRDLQNAVAAYIGEVEEGTFPSQEFEYTQAESTGRLKYDVV